MCQHTTFLMHIALIDDVTLIPAFLHTLTLFCDLSSDDNLFPTKRKGLQVTSNGEENLKGRSKKKQ